MRMPAVAREKLAARFQRIQQMKCADRSPRPMRFTVVVRDHERGPSILLDHPRGGDADYPAMPALAVNHHAVRITQSRFLLNSLVNRLQDVALFFLPLGIQLIKPPGDLSSAHRIFHAE